jgi:hypothetical protein
MAPSYQSAKVGIHQSHDIAVTEQKKSPTLRREDGHHAKPS